MRTADFGKSVAARVTVRLKGVGAGDADMSDYGGSLPENGVMGALERHKLHTIDESAITAIMGYAARVAAVTVGRAGANPPSLDEVTMTG